MTSGFRLFLSFMIKRLMIKEILLVLNSYQLVTLLKLWYFKENRSYFISTDHFTARKWSCGKVMFLHIFVILSTRGGMMSLPVWSHVPSLRYHPGGGMVPGGMALGALVPGRWEGTPETTKTGSTHSTGMLSCNCLC